MNDKILSQIICIRDTGLTNMFDYRMVQQIAYEKNMYELVNYIEEDPQKYCEFILNGKEPK